MRGESVEAMIYRLQVLMAIYGRPEPYGKR